MATRDELIGALTKADAAGDSESANIFASKIKEMDTAAEPRGEISKFRALEHADPGTDTYAQAAAAVKPQPGIPAPTTDLNATPMVAPTPEENAFNDRVKREQQKMLREGDPTKGMNNVARFMVGNTQQFSDAVLAGQQFANAASGGLIGDKEALAKEAAIKAAADAPLLRTRAGGAGAFLGRAIPEVAAFSVGGFLPVSEKIAATTARFLPEPVLAAGRAVGSKVGSAAKKVDEAADWFVNSVMPGAYRSTGVTERAAAAKAAARETGAASTEARIAAEKAAEKAAEAEAAAAARGAPSVDAAASAARARTAAEAEAAAVKAQRAKAAATRTTESGMIPRSVFPVVDRVAESAAASAALQQFNPSANYDPLENAKIGAMFGAGGDLAGRLVGRVISPTRRFANKEFQPIPGNPFSAERVPTSATQRIMDIEKLQEAELLPNVLTAHLGNNKVLDAATAAAAKIPFFGRNIARALDENAVALTKRQAVAAGLSEGVADLTPDASQVARRLRDTAETKASFFRNLDTPVPMDTVHPDLQAAHRSIERHAEAVSRAEAAAKVGRAAEAVAPEVAPAAATAGAAEAAPLRQTIEDAMTDSLAESATARAGAPAGTVPQTRTIAELMDLRNVASKLVKGESDGTIRRGYQEMRDIYTDAIERALPEEERGGFREWLKEYGEMKDFARAADKSGGVALDPKKTLKAYVPEMLDRVAPPPNSTADLLATLNRVNPSLSNAGIATPWGRVAGILGQTSPGLAIGGSVLHQVFSDKGDPLTAAVDLGAGASAAAIMAGLLGPRGATYFRGQHPMQSQALRDALRRMSTVGAVEAHQIRKEK